MKIQIYSRAFPPAVGGMERLMETLAREFARLGHSVHVVTETETPAEFPFPVYRRPTFWEFVRLGRSSDVILSAPLSLKRLPAQLMSGTKIYVSHPDRFGGTGTGAKGIHAPLSFVKRRISRFLVNIVPSQFLAQFFQSPRVILNPYDTRAFYPPTTATERAGILFVGRLDASKGCHLLVEAFAQIAAEFPRIDLTVVGGGPDIDNLVNQAARLRIADRMHFAGYMRGPALTEVMQRHLIMVVPSIMEEPFGIVALEGLACGCRMVVSKTGGLPEAVGPFAEMFRSGDTADLASCLRKALRHEPSAGEAERVKAYLREFTPTAIAKQYLALFGAQHI